MSLNNRLKAIIINASNTTEKKLCKNATKYRAIEYVGGVSNFVSNALNGFTICLSVKTKLVAVKMFLLIKPNIIKLNEFIVINHTTGRVSDCP